MQIQEFDEDLYNLVKLFLDSNANKDGDYEQMQVFAIIAALEARKTCLIKMVLGKSFVAPKVGE